MRAIEDTLKDAKGLVNKIYENMSTVETCEAIREQIADMKICYTKEGDSVLVLDGVLDDDQAKQVNTFIINLINKRRDESQKYLDFLAGKIPAIENPVFEAAVQEMVESAKKPSVQEKPEPTTEQAQKWLDDGKSIKELSELLGVPCGSVNAKLKKLGALRKVKVEINQTKKLTADDEVDIKRMYCTEKKNLQEIAEHFGVKKTDVHDFIVFHHIQRPTKEEEQMYRDAMYRDRYKDRTPSSGKKA